MQQILPSRYGRIVRLLAIQDELASTLSPLVRQVLVFSLDCQGPWLNACRAFQNVHICLHEKKGSSFPGIPMLGIGRKRSDQLEDLWRSNQFFGEWDSENIYLRKSLA